MVLRAAAGIIPFASLKDATQKSIIMSTDQYPQAELLSRLRKGDACMYCRRRKMKCDGARPICGQCARGNRQEDCEYAVSSGLSRTQSLEDTIARVEARIRELENPDGVVGPSSSAIALSHPYTDTPGAQILQLTATQGIPAHLLEANAMPLQPAEPFGNWMGHGEPHAQVVQLMTDNILRHSDQLGFFLHERRFREAMLLGPHSTELRPAPVLIAASYLWGVKLFGSSPVIVAIEAVLLDRTLQAMSSTLAGNHPLKQLHAIQAEVLLVSYFFAAGRLLEGRYHVTTAVALTIASGLHMIRSAVEDAPVDLSNIGYLPPPRDVIEEGERIRGCWMVFVMDKSWAAALDSSPHILCPTEASGTQFDTPWPLEMSEYEQGMLHPNFRTSSTVRRFYYGDTVLDDSASSLALLAKATLIWERARDLVINQWRPDLSPQESQDFMHKFLRLDILINQVTEALTVATVGDDSNVMLARCIINTAAIKLHSSLAYTNRVSKNKCMFAAQAILFILSMLADVHRGSGESFVNPIIGSTWTAACQMLLNELSSVRSARGSIRSGQDDIEEDLRQMLAVGFDAMAILTHGSALVAYQVELTEQAYATQVA